MDRLWPLALLPVAVLLLALAGHPRPWLRIVAVLLLIVAACGPSLPLASRRAVLIEVVDASASVGLTRDGGSPFSSPEGVGWADGDYACIEFGRQARILRPFGAPRIARGTGRVDPSATNVEQALLLAVAQAPIDASLTVWLRSDGRETDGDARPAIARVRQRGGRLFTSPLAPPQPDLRVVALSAPSEVAEAERVAVEVAVGATEEMRARVSLLANGVVLAERDGVEVAPQRDVHVAFDLPPLASPVLPIEARVAAGAPDRLPENDSAWVVVRRAGRPKVLLVAEPGRRLEQVLRASGAFDLCVSASFEALAGYDAVVLDDRPADGLPDLETYVRKARGGLVVAGGPRSFGPGGYAGTPLERLLPVWSLPQEAFSLVVLLDASGSMAEGTTGATKYETALLALDAVRDLLRPTDRVEVVSFAGAVSAGGLSDASAFPAQLAAARAVRPSGSTAILPALERAVSDLEKEPTSRRHLLVVTDGELASGEVGSPSFASFGERLDRIGAGRTVLVTGTRPAEADLRALGGRYLPLARLEDLPRVLREDLVQAKRVVEDRPEAPRRSARDPLLPDLDRCPPVGRDRVTAKREARVDFAFEDGAPLYAGWQVGLGRVIAVATTLEAPWGSAWEADPESTRIWVEAVRWALRPPGTPEVEWQVRDGRLEVVFPGPFRRLSARLVPAVGGTVEVPLDPIGRDRYAGTVPDLPAGIGAIELHDEDESLATGAIALPVGAEYRSVGVDRARLEEWARLGGGRVIEAGLPEQPAEARGAPWPVGGWLAALAVGLFFVDALRQRRVV